MFEEESTRLRKVSERFDELLGALNLDQTINYNPPRHPSTQNPTSDQLNAVWGDGYGNRVDRFLATVRAA